MIIDLLTNMLLDYEKEFNIKPDYIIVDRKSFLDLKEYLEIPGYNKFHKFLGIEIVSIELPYTEVRLIYTGNEED